MRVLETSITLSYDVHGTIRDAMKALSSPPMEDIFPDIQRTETQKVVRRAKNYTMYTDYSFGLVLDLRASLCPVNPKKYGVCMRMLS